MNGAIDGSISGVNQSESDAMLERDYRAMCALLGWMPFDDFASGYRAMADWHDHGRFSSHLSEAAVA